MDLKDPSDSGAPSRSRRPLTSYLSLAHVIMLVAGTLAFLLVLLVLRDRDATTEVVVAAGDLEQGQTVDADSLRVVDLPAAVLELGSLAAPALATTATDAGWKVQVALAEGAPLRIGDVAPPLSHGVGRLMAISVDPNRAVAGALVPGDRVDVIRAAPDRAQYVSQYLEVVGVDSGGSRSGGSTLTLTVVVTPEAGLLIASALSAGDVHVVRSTGAAAPSLTDAHRDTTDG
ncbi:MAG: SAF domain-containing protein [Acidimicrobiia bacterium]